MTSRKPEGSRLTVAFLLSQVGGRSAQEFARLLEPLKLAPSDAGILRLLGLEPGISQQELARRLGMYPSRLVAMIDALEERGLVARREHASDRRTHALELSGAGREALRAVATAAKAHEGVMCDGLSEVERAQIGVLLGKIAARHGLAEGVHPGYRTLSGSGSQECPHGKREKK